MSIDAGNTTADGKMLYDPNLMVQITNMTVMEAESRFTQAEISNIKREF